MTQLDLAQRLALASNTHIAKLEASQDAPSLDLVLRIARLFGVTTDALLRDTVPVEAVAAPAVAPLHEEVTAAPHSFGARLRAMRLTQHWSQTDVARQLGLASRAYISNLEAGRKSPSLVLLVQAADLFGVTTDDLLRDSAARAASDLP